MTDFITQLQNDTTLQAALIVFVICLASMLGGIGRLLLLTIVGVRMFRLAAIFGLGAGATAMFAF